MIRSLTLACTLVLVTSGCAGGLATTRLDLGDVDGIVKAPLSPTDGAVYAAKHEASPRLTRAKAR